MIFRRHILHLPLLLSVFTVMIGYVEAKRSSMTLKYRRVVDGRPLSLDSLRFVNASEETYSVSRLSYLISGFELETVDGTFVQIPDAYAWIDAESRRTFR